MSNNQQPQAAPGFFAGLHDEFLDFIASRTPSQRRTYLVLSLLVAAVLITLASLSFLNLNSWIYALIGFPAGIILFLDGLALFHFTGLRDTRLASYRETMPPARRLRDVAVAVVILVVLLIVLGGTSYFPHGLGGAIVVAVALAAYNITRRTPEELRLAAAGIPDPREVQLQAEAALEDEDEEEER